MGIFIRGVKFEVSDGNLIVLFDEPRRVVSSAVLNGGMVYANAILNHQVDKNFDHKDPEGYLKSVIEELRLKGTIVGLMTAANVEKYGFSRYEEDGIAVTSIITAGVSNASTCGEPIDRHGVGTINIIVLIEASMTDSCMVEAIKTATEAKCRALTHLDIRSVNSGELATGTTTDSIAIAELGGKMKLRYSGPGTKLGELIGRTVFEALIQALEKNEGLKAGRSLLDRLRERGVTLEDMINAGLEMFIPHPGVETKEKAAEMLKEELLELISDVNISSLVLAGLRLEEDAKRGLIPGLSPSSYSKDPVFLVADEILGMSIANYAAGTLGHFEYVRFDKAKPGIIGKLGPFTDDVIGALIASASSRMYSRAMRNLKEKA
ncbi:MAG: bifunctional adenosylcobinamide hydrolase/alpha-ribazole phosphatase CbiS [Candidatus Nezhaarchaeales archaeon]